MEAINQTNLISTPSGSQSAWFITLYMAPLEQSPKKSKKSRETDDVNVRFRPEADIR